MFDSYHFQKTTEKYNIFKKLYTTNFIFYIFVLQKNTSAPTEVFINVSVAADFFNKNVNV